jgi:hypothetical protein
MQRNFIPFKTAFSLFAFYFLLFAGKTQAQNQGSFKYILDPETPADYNTSTNIRVLEVNNHYYILSAIDTNFINHIPFSAQIFVSVFDENLNKIQQIAIDSFIHYFFYTENHFYFMGVARPSVEPPVFYFMKCDEDFNCEPPAYTHIMDDTTLFIRIYNR